MDFKPGKDSPKVYQTLMVLSLAALVAAWFWHIEWPAWLAAGLLALGLVAYPLARWIHLAWMGLATGLGWVNSRILLGIIFFLLLWPLARLRRWFQPEVIAKGADPGLSSYYQDGPDGDVRVDFEKPW